MVPQDSPQAVAEQRAWSACDERDRAIDRAIRSEAECARLRKINTALLKALKSFADFSSDVVPFDLTIAQGSYARRQLTMGDCHQAAAAIAKATNDGRE